MDFSTVQYIHPNKHHTHNRTHHHTHNRTHTTEHTQYAHTADHHTTLRMESTWVLIDRNIIQQPSTTTTEDVECLCQADQDGFGCGDSCLNRFSNIECVDSVCTLGPGCRNRQFQCKRYTDTEVLNTPLKGKP